VATWPRWLASSATLAAALVAAVQGYLLFTYRNGHGGPTLATFAPALLVGGAIGSVLVFAQLRAEESRLARELRTARTGTAVLRGMVTRRRQQLPFLARWAEAKLGAAAVLLADGDREGARDAMVTGSVFARGGRIERLRAIVEADFERTAHTSVGLERCVQRLRAADRTGNREADLYRVLVLVKAVLEQGDGETGAELVNELGQSTDEEERVYATWLRVWFGFDDDAPPPASVPWPPLTEGDLRVAALAARAHGAEKLVEKLSQMTGQLPHVRS
jgi:hypothetical protein